MSGRPIRAEGELDAAAVAERTDRMEIVAGRRSPVILDNLMIWLGLALLASLLSRGRLAGPAFSLGWRSPRPTCRPCSSSAPPRSPACWASD